MKKLVLTKHDNFTTYSSQPHTSNAKLRVKEKYTLILIGALQSQTGLGLLHWTDQTSFSGHILFAILEVEVKVFSHFEMKKVVWNCKKMQNISLYPNNPSIQQCKFCFECLVKQELFKKGLILRDRTVSTHYKMKRKI